MIERQVADGKDTMLKIAQVTSPEHTHLRNLNRESSSGKLVAFTIRMLRLGDQSCLSFTNLKHTGLGRPGHPRHSPVLSVSVPSR